MTKYLRDSRVKLPEGYVDGMRWVTNHIPNSPPQQELDESPEQAWARQEEWLEGIKAEGARVGPPSASAYLSREEMEAVGLVGIYLPTEPR